MESEVGPGTMVHRHRARELASRLGRGLRHVPRPVLAIVFLLLLLAFVWRQRSVLQETLVVLRQADGAWLTGLLVTALVMHLLFALTLSSLLSILGHRIPPRAAITTYAERQTVATIVPFGGVPSLLVLMRRFAPYGVTADDAILSVVLLSGVGHLSFAVYLIPILAWILMRHAATGVVVAAAVLLLVLVVVIVTFAITLLGGGRLPHVLARRLPERAHAFIDAARAHHLHPRALTVPFGLSLLADIAGAACVYVALRAIGVNASIGTAAAGYAIGTLFYLIAPLFQGLGIVELSMTIALQQLGVPAPQALGATLLYRSGEVWLPVVFGIALQARHEKRLIGLPAHLPALWTGFNGIVAVLSVMPSRLLPHFRPYGQSDPFRFVALPNASRSVVLASGILLILCSYSLLRRRRTAWVAATALTAVVAIVQLSRDFDRLSSLIAAVNVALLLLYRGRFRVRSDPPTVRRGLAMFALMSVTAFAYGIGSLWLIDRRHFGEEFSIRSAFLQTADVFFSLDSAGLAPRTAYAEWLVTSFHLVGAFSVLVAVVALVRPVVWRHRTMPDEIERARSLISAYGGSSQDFFKYWPDKVQFFSSTGDGVISYRVSSGVAVSLGDPVGNAPDARRRVLAEFLDFCDANGWEAAFHQATPRFLDDYRLAGMVPLMIGAEAVVHVGTFTLTGKKAKGFRGVLNRFEREGYRAVLHEPPISPPLLRQLRQVSDAWLTLEGRRERGFTLGQFTEGYVARCPVLALESAEGRVDAFINLIPDGVPGEMTFDLMRHRPDAPNGAMDFLMVRLIQHAQAQGFRRVSLGMVPLVDAESGPDMAWRERALALLTERLGRFFDAASLWRYKDKFGPTWEPRFLVYQHHARLPSIGLAIARLTEGSSVEVSSLPTPAATSRSDAA